MLLGDEPLSEPSYTQTILIFYGFLDFNDILQDKCSSVTLPQALTPPQGLLPRDSSPGVPLWSPNRPSNFVRASMLADLPILRVQPSRSGVFHGTVVRADDGTVVRTDDGSIVRIPRFTVNLCHGITVENPTPTAPGHGSTGSLINSPGF